MSRDYGATAFETLGLFLGFLGRAHWQGLQEPDAELRKKFHEYRSRMAEIVRILCNTPWLLYAGKGIEMLADLKYYDTLIRFTEKPQDSLRIWLKAAGFHWSKKLKVWQQRIEVAPPSVRDTLLAKTQCVAAFLEAMLPRWGPLFEELKKRHQAGQC